MIEVVLEGTKVTFEPSAPDIEVSCQIDIANKHVKMYLQSVVLSGFSMMMEAIRSVPRVETKLYPVEVCVAQAILYTTNYLCCRVVKTKETSHQLLLKKSLKKQKKR